MHIFAHAEESTSTLCGEGAETRGERGRAGSGCLMPPEEEARQGGPDYAQPRKGAAAQVATPRGGVGAAPAQKNLTQSSRSTRRLGRGSGSLWLWVSVFVLGAPRRRAPRPGFRIVGIRVFASDFGARLCLASGFREMPNAAVRRRTETEAKCRKRRRSRRPTTRNAAAEAAREPRRFRHAEGHGTSTLCGEGAGARGGRGRAGSGCLMPPEEEAGRAGPTTRSPLKGQRRRLQRDTRRRGCGSGAEESHAEFAEYAEPWARLRGSVTLGSLCLWWARRLGALRGRGFGLSGFGFSLPISGRGSASRRDFAKCRTRRYAAARKLKRNAEKGGEAAGRQPEMPLRTRRESRAAFGTRRARRGTAPRRFAERVRGHAGGGAKRARDA